MQEHISDSSIDAHPPLTLSSPAGKARNGTATTDSNMTNTFVHQYDHTMRGNYDLLDCDYQYNSCKTHSRESSLESLQTILTTMPLEDNSHLAVSPNSTFIKDDFSLGMGEILDSEETILSNTHQPTNWCYPSFPRSIDFGDNCASFLHDSISNHFLVSHGSDAFTPSDFTGQQNFDTTQQASNYENLTAPKQTGSNTIADAFPTIHPPNLYMFNPWHSRSYSVRNQEMYSDGYNVSTVFDCEDIRGFSPDFQQFTKDGPLVNVQNSPNPSLSLSLLAQAPLQLNNVNGGNGTVEGIHYGYQNDQQSASNIKKANPSKETNGGFDTFADGTIKVCSNCRTTVTPSWRRCSEGKRLLCNACGLYQKLHHRDRPIYQAADGKIKVRRGSTTDPSYPNTLLSKKHMVNDEMSTAPTISDDDDDDGNDNDDSSIEYEINDHVEKAKCKICGNGPSEMRTIMMSAYLSGQICNLCAIAKAYCDSLAKAVLQQTKRENRYQENDNPIINVKQQEQPETSDVGDDA